MELIKKILIAIILYALLIAVTVIFLGDVMALDQALFLIINSFSNTYVNSLFLFITFAGTSILWIAMIIIFWAEKKREISMYLLFVFLLDSLSHIFLKTFFMRPRPYEIFPAKLLGFDIDLGAGFPSGHTQRAFSGAVILGSFYKKMRIPLLLLAVLVGISRIYIGVHYPLDVLAGAANGMIFGMIALNLPYKKLLKKLESL